MQINFIKLESVMNMFNSTSLEKIKSLVRPMVDNYISQVVISFAVGYYATTKLLQFLKHGINLNKNVTPNEESPKEDGTGDGKALKLTAKQLMKYCGLDDKEPIFTALNGKIYDLSEGRDLYKPTGPYSLLAGCDANKVLAIACGFMNVSTNDLIQSWEQRLNAEFKVVGYLVDSDNEEGCVEEDQLK